MSGKNENSNLADVAALQQIVNDLAYDKPEQMTMLDRFALAAMQGMISNYEVKKSPVDGKKFKDWEMLLDYADRVAKDSYILATAMIRRREALLRK